MRHGRWVAVTAVLAIVLSLSATPGSAVAHPPKLGTVTVTLELVRVHGDPDFLPAPEPGAAVANIIGYDFNLWAYVWKCSYAGWDSIQVSWSCRLRLRVSGAQLKEQKGTFSGGSFNPGPWYYFMDPKAVCVKTDAWYTAYPSQSDSHEVCKN